MKTHRPWCLATEWWTLKSLKGHKISMSSIQEIKLGHQDRELITYADKSDADLKYLIMRNNFFMAMWHSTQWVTQLPVLCTEQSHSSPWLLLPHMQALLSLQQGNTLARLYNTSLLFFPFFNTPHSILHHSQRAKQTSKPWGQDSYKIILQPRKFQPVFGSLVSCSRANSACPPSAAGRSINLLAGIAHSFFCRTQLCRINKSPAAIYVQITCAKGPFGRKASICVHSSTGVMAANKHACCPPHSLQSHSAFVTQHFALLC